MGLLKPHSRVRPRLHLRQIATLHLWDVASNSENGYGTHCQCLTQHPHRHNVSILTQTHTQTWTHV